VTPSVLIIGYSSIASRRIIPALHALDPRMRIDIASLSKRPPDTLRETGEIFDDYARGLSGSPAEIAYVSLHNAAHFKWVMKALSSGRHVIVDKPAFLRLEEAEQALDLAHKAGRHIVEATVFNYHAQFLELDRFIAQHGPIQSLSVEFIIPQLPDNNFRVHANLGGGCFADMSPYAAAIVRLFGEGDPLELSAAGVRNQPAAADSAFSMLAAFVNGTRITGHFCIEGSYRNRMTFMARDAICEVDRVLSPPPDLPPSWRVTRDNKETIRTLDPDDAFRSFFAQTLKVIDDPSDSTLENILMQDAKFRDRLARIALS
jgi:dTDP-3,4-didehydro-2,6-dideoxy-alpha-D-glucose 3-reductase